MAELHMPRPVFADAIYDKSAEKQHMINVTTTTISDPDSSTDSEEESFSGSDLSTVLSPSQTPPFPSLTATRIISSPYPFEANKLNLSTLDPQSRLLSLALTQLLPIREDYATAPWLHSFNWGEIFTLLRDLCAQSKISWQRREFYVVIFRSRLKKDADREKLGLLDRKSHEEACASGGLLRYWFGRTSDHSEGRNLATCVWRNREDAFNGGRGPWHRKARGAAREMYEDITFHTHRFAIDDVAFEWTLEDFVE